MHRFSHGLPLLFPYSKQPECIGLVRWSVGADVVCPLVVETTAVTNTASRTEPPSSELPLFGRFMTWISRLSLLCVFHDI